LAKRRKEFRLSVEDVSNRLKISPRQIAALESDDFAQLASMATVRGFIRSYCKLLELDPAPLIAMLSNEPNPAFDSMVVRRPLPAPGLRGRQSPPPRRRSSSKWPSLVMAAAVVIALVFIAYRYEWFSVPSVDYAKVIDALPPLTGGREASSPEAGSEKAGVLSSLGIVASSASALEIKAREDSWVEVTTVEGERRLISRLMKAGTTELVEVNEPVVLVIGNAAGVDASLRGQTLNLRAVARDNVAKLSLK
jgi:cytoskeleton protein RodZ